ncbi:hypothetical protein CLAFUW4_11370 [Fulvia fulva]|uniref:Uncharacterized protein n=1 Tax=Passalora fulva TaxID=5499 RepID=A0A9Q8PD62_PASFU|nr:uncharacterized protein CLAFUR5_10412 [Fulvia fulva]KAK4620122.1 hypothetical protein CLAFUR4_11376 [Fulvia fulva]UJO20266.1 hypothetical protein CLAFUR5_10412 [Fulvia fulva]WPV16889.1 hypothetical protein CLAFUW4_11370 [Fulvia fulva]WPV32358.1 hypothetical protein CLAFUW7_11366 [Fulvia fulva]
MMAEIGKHLDLNSKLRLRLALVKHRQGDVVEMLKEPLKVLYVSPSRTSLRNFKQICQCEYFQQYIVEVVFLPSVIDVAGERPV